ncbi:MAG: hypothetical protein ACYTGB_10695 [Planctomycetota bacterium]
MSSVATRKVPRWMTSFSPMSPLSSLEPYSPAGSSMRAGPVSESCSRW